MTLLGVHEDPPGTVAKLHPETDGKHVSHVGVDVCDILVSGILGRGFGDSPFAPLLGILAGRGNLCEPMEVSRQANAQLQDL